MIFIGGVSDKTVEVDTLKATMCKHCRESYPMAVFKNYHFFHFFFIPLWKWNHKYYVTCEGCQTIMTIPLEKGKELELGEQIDLTLWDLEVIREGDDPQKKCSHCRENIDKAYQYCPHCGERM